MVQVDGSTNGRRRVAIYCRVSTSEQDNDRQERDLLEYADRADFEVVEVFKEIEKLSQREIAKRLGLSKTTVNEILKRRREQTPGSGPSGS